MVRNNLSFFKTDNVKLFFVFLFFLTLIKHLNPSIYVVTSEVFSHLVIKTGNHGCPPASVAG